MLSWTQAIFWFAGLADQDSWTKMSAWLFGLYQTSSTKFVYMNKTLKPELSRNPLNPTPSSKELQNAYQL